MVAGRPDRPLSTDCLVTSVEQQNVILAMLIGNDLSDRLPHQSLVRAVPTKNQISNGDTTDTWVLSQFEICRG